MSDLKSRRVQYVSFKLGGETYALDISHAREIVDAPPLTQLPSAPRWIPGLMNLRGHILPVVDLKRKFGLEGGEEVAQRRYVIVAEVAATSAEGRVTLLGVLVDAVLEVFDLDDTDLEPPPKFGERFSRAYLLGMAKRGATIVAVMDATKVLSDSEAALQHQEGIAAAVTA